VSSQWNHQVTSIAIRRCPQPTFRRRHRRPSHPLGKIHSHLWRPHSLRFQQRNLRLCQHKLRFHPVPHRPPHNSENFWKAPTLHRKRLIVLREQTRLRIWVSGCSRSVLQALEFFPYVSCNGWTDQEMFPFPRRFQDATKYASFRAINQDHLNQCWIPFFGIARSFDASLFVR
jgi:hypothetical protein